MTRIILLIVALLSSLICGGSDAEAGQPSEIPDRAPGFASSQASISPVHHIAFRETGDLAIPRAQHSATLLPDGRVLIAGGETSRWLAISSAELYDPQTSSFVSTGGMSTISGPNSAFLLPDGTVAVFGTSTAEVYDPATGQFSLATNFPYYREMFATTVLPDGNILISGGRTKDQQTTYISSWVYDWRTRTLVAAGNLLRARSSHVAVLLGDNSVLVVGGIDASYFILLEAELYDTGLGNGITISNSAVYMRSHIVKTVLPDGDVLLIDNCETRGYVNQTQLYDHVTKTFSAFPAGIGSQRMCFTATQLANGDLVLLGGTYGFSQLNMPATWFSWTSREFYSNSSIRKGRYLHTATLLQDGRVLIVGGEDQTVNGGVLQSAEVGTVLDFSVSLPLVQR